MRPSAPTPLNETHELDEFDCGDVSLNDWLRKRARKNDCAGASRTYVVCVERRVIAYYCLAAGSVANQTAPGKVRRNMPDPIPVVVLGRLATDRSLQGKGFGRALLRDAVLRTIAAAEIAGIRAIVVHAITEEATRFYQDCGFMESPLAPLTMMITLDDARVRLQPSP